jgi:hypothetical protein
VAGPPTPGDITDFTITFTELPAGVTIDPTSLSTGQNCAACTQFASSPFVAGNQWVPVLSNGNDTITFTAPTGFELNFGREYFVNILFTGRESSVTFTGGWSSVPEPGSGSLLLLGTAAGLCVAVLRRRAARGVS